MYTSLDVKYPSFMSDFSVQWEQRCSMRTDRHDKLTVAFRNIVKVSNN